MPTLTYLGNTYDCTTAIKGSDYIHLLDENGVMVASFDGIADFKEFTLNNGSYTSPTADHNCYLAVIRDDGTIGKGGHTCSGVANKNHTHTAADVGAHDLVNRGTNIPTGSNLNSYTTPGDYYVASADVSAISNAPFTTGFRMVIERSYGAATSILQIANAGPRYAIRSYDNGTWGNWWLHYSNFGLGVAIPSNADMNTYTTEGVYYSPSSAISASLTNPPAKSAGFRLIVERGYADSHRIQTAIFGATGRVFTRYYASSTWTAWAETVKTSNGLLSLSNSGWCQQLEIVRTDSGNGSTCIKFVNANDQVGAFGFTANGNPVVFVGADTADAKTVLHTGNAAALGFAGVSEGAYTGTESKELTLPVPDGTKMLIITGGIVDSGSGSATSIMPCVLYPGQTAVAAATVSGDCPNSSVLDDIDYYLMTVSFSGTSCVITGTTHKNALNFNGYAYKWFAFT